MAFRPDTVPLAEEERTWLKRALTSENDPERTLGRNVSARLLPFLTRGPFAKC